MAVAVLNVLYRSVVGAVFGVICGNQDCRVVGCVGCMWTPGSEWAALAKLFVCTLHCTWILWCSWSS